MNKMKKFVDIQQIKLEDIDLGNGIVRANNVSGFQVGDNITITEKVDGSNASVRLDTKTGNLLAFSRNRQLSQTNTLNGFWNYVQTLKAEMLMGYDSVDYVIFGEWMGNGDRMNKITYKETKGKWIVFDIYDTTNETYIDPMVVKSFCNTWGLEYVHEFYCGPFVSWDEVKKYLHMNSYGDRQEGIVIRNESLKLRNAGKENNRTPYILKIVNEDFKESMVKEKKPVDPTVLAEKARCFDLMTSIITDNRVDKIFGKAVMDGDLAAEVRPEDMGSIIRFMGKAVWDDLVKEENEVLLSVGESAGKLCSKIVAEKMRKKIVGV